MPDKPLSESRTIKGGAVAVVATSGVVIIEALNEIASTLEPFVQYSDTVKYIFMAVTLASVGLMVWARIDDAKSGARP